MKRSWLGFTGGILTMALVWTADATAAVSADPVRAKDGSRYAVRHLESLGGTNSSGIGIDNRGRVTGYSTLPGDATMHAATWHGGSVTDLQTLGGPNSAVLWPVKNDHGIVAGVTETETMDPLGEAWSCSAFFPDVTGHTCRGFVWADGRMRALPTLGGNNGFATGVNNRGQVIGWAENSVADPTCNPPQVLQFRATVWDARTQRVRELRPFPGDSVSAATAINDRGVVVGISGSCDNAVGRFSARHAVMWVHGRVFDLGSLGGISWNTPMAINNRGAVVGFANRPGDEDGEPNLRPFKWTRSGGFRALPLLPDDTTGQALGINHGGTAVGMSCGSAGCRAVIWRDDRVVDLGSLLPDTYAGQLGYANDINDRGQITGRATDPSTEDDVAFIATPTGRK